MSLTKIAINAERLRLDFEELARIGATVEGGISRLALSNEDLEARSWLADKFDRAGLIVHDDDAGNLSGILPAKDPTAQTLLIGSHMDSVPGGGVYDCSVGTLAALECLRTLNENHVRFDFHIEAVDFTDEEGTWQSLFGSRAMIGLLDDLYPNDTNIDYGPFRAALFRAGIRPMDIHRARRAEDSIKAYLELHIEQGYILDQKAVEIGIVTAIVGRTTYRLTFFGEASHSGTTAMVRRRDALHGASEFITLAYDYVETHFPEGVFSCGNLQVAPGKFNIIPDKSVLTMEFRHADAQTLAEMESELLRLARDIATKHGLSVNARPEARMPAAVMDTKIQQTIKQACETLNINYMPIVSYAGHDAQILNSIAPTAMIFVPSVDGISHSPKEFTEWDHIVKGTNVLLHTILSLGERV